MPSVAALATSISPGFGFAAGCWPKAAIVWELTARGAQEGDAPRPRARRGVGARERSRKRSPFEVKTREESASVKLFLREEGWKSLEKIRSYFILLHLWSRFHRSPAILLEVRLLVWTIGCYLIS